MRLLINICCKTFIKLSSVIQYEQTAFLRKKWFNIDKIEQIKTDNLNRKNGLVIKATLVSVILAAIVDIVLQKELAIILAITIAGR